MGREHILLLPAIEVDAGEETPSRGNGWRVAEISRGNGSGQRWVSGMAGAKPAVGI